MLCSAWHSICVGHRILAGRVFFRVHDRTKDGLPANAGVQGVSQTAMLQIFGRSVPRGVASEHTYICMYLAVFRPWRNAIRAGNHRCASNCAEAHTTGRPCLEIPFSNRTCIYSTSVQAAAAPRRMCGTMRRALITGTTYSAPQWRTQSTLLRRILPSVPCGACLSRTHARMNRVCRAAPYRSVLFAPRLCVCASCRSPPF